MGCNDEVLAIRARVWLAQQRLQQSLQQTYTSNFDISQKSSAVQEKESPLTSDDWQNILNHLYKMKNEERLSAVSEGDPRRFQDLAAAIGQTSSKDNPCN
jgi:phycocyanobilin lyase beta subunit